MINIIFAPPRYGKTCYMTYKANELAFDRLRLKAAQSEINLLNDGGFNYELPGDSIISSNYPMIFKKFGYSKRHTRIINPYRLGFYNEFVDTHLDIPYGVYCITESQKYLNSRKSKEFPDWQSRWYEQHGHLYLDILLDTQRVKLIDANIRELASFTEIVHLKTIYDEFDKPCKLIWTIRELENSEVLDGYLSSGKRDKDCYVEKKVVADYNVFSLYDSRCCKPKFFEGKFDKKIDYTTTPLLKTTKEDFSFYYDKLDDKRPKDFYVKVANVKKAS